MQWVNFPSYEMLEERMTKVFGDVNFQTVKGINAMTEIYNLRGKEATFNEVDVFSEWLFEASPHDLNYFRRKIEFLLITEFCTDF